MNPPRTTLRLDPARVFPLHMAIIAIGALPHLLQTLMLAAADAAAPLTNIINLDNENSVMTLFSGVALAGAGLAAFLARSGARERRVRFFWLVLGWAFVFFAADEIASFHERLIRIGDWLQLTGALWFGWYIVYAPALVILALVLARGFLSLDWPTQAGLALGASIAVSGAVGVEMISSQAAWDRVQALGVSKAEAGLYWPYHLITFFEETLEMIGVAVMLRAILRAAAGESLIVQVAATPERLTQPQGSAAPAKSPPPSSP